MDRGLSIAAFAAFALAAGAGVVMSAFVPAHHRDPYLMRTSECAYPVSDKDRHIVRCTTFEGTCDKKAGKWSCKLLPLTVERSGQ